MDAAIAILSGAHGLVEINKRVRAERGWPAAFGRHGGAEQSVVPDTLAACSQENVSPMPAALDQIYSQHSQGYGHDYHKSWQLLDVALTGRPGGKKAGFASKGDFATQRHRPGRHEGYLSATNDEEIVSKQLFNGKTQLTKAWPPLRETAAKTLGLDQDQAKRQRTIWRIVSGGGSVEGLNWVLKRGSQLPGKDYSGPRTQHLAESVLKWFNDPGCPERPVGGVTVEADLYCRPVKRLAVRCRKHNGQWGIGGLLSTLSSPEVLKLTGDPLAKASAPRAVLLAYVHFYDQRDGGVETAIKEDKQGRGTSKRNQKRFEAQYMLTLLEALAHNILVWARPWLAHWGPRVAQFGWLRLVRDVFQMNGLILLDPEAQLLKIVLNRADPLVQELRTGFAALFAPQQLAMTLGEI